jgi:hypothetical protein
MAKMPEVKLNLYSTGRSGDGQFTHRGTLIVDGKPIKVVGWFDANPGKWDDGNDKPQINIKTNTRAYEDAFKLIEDRQGENVIDHPHLRETDHSAKLDEMYMMMGNFLDRMSRVEEQAALRDAEEEGTPIDAQA